MKRAAIELNHCLIQLSIFDVRKFFFQRSGYAIGFILKSDFLDMLIYPMYILKLSIDWPPILPLVLFCKRQSQQFCLLQYLNLITIIPLLKY